MSATLDDRVTVLEGKMEMLEADPQPGQNKAFSDNLIALRREFKEFGAVQKRHGETLDMQTGKLTGLGNALTDLSMSVDVVKIEFRDFKDVVSGRLERLDGDVAELKGDVAELKGGMVEVKGALAEILDRLPPKAA
ncbi:MAG: hypothetical protein ACRDP7_41240 [Trebonia sp.]